MMGMFSMSLLLAAAIPLSGVTGDRLRARAFTDANNVKVGDPIVLTIMFDGTADFRSLHPPALSRYVDGNDWKLDDSSARTQTESREIGSFFSRREVDIARSLTYRVRPRREGVLWFPALEFEFQNAAGERMTVRSNAIPVHARAGQDVVVAEMSDDADALPQPDELIIEPGVPLNEDDAFAWRKALNDPTPDAFAAFDFPAARLNEATTAIRAGDWGRALKVYSRLEWSVGQTPAIERGIVAALALRYRNPAAELPVWRQVGRVVLRHGWKGRLGLVGGGFLAAFLFFWLVGRLIRRFACLALALLAVTLATPAHAQLFRPFGGSGFSISINGQNRPEAKVVARLKLSNPRPKVGERFDFILELETPKWASVSLNQCTASQAVGLVFLEDRVRQLPPGQTDNPSNQVSRVAIAARYDMPYRGELSFSIGGMVSGTQTVTTAHGHSSFTFSNSFTEHTDSTTVEVQPIEGAPADFSGIVGAELSFSESVDNLKVGTNDVLRINYRLRVDGFVPEDWLPEGAAFECGRQRDNSGALVVVWQRYFVADGSQPETPMVKVVYYGAKDKKFKTVSTGGSRIEWQGY